MKSAIIKYILFTAALFLGAIGLAQTDLFTAGEALMRAVTLFVIANIFLILRFLFNWLKKSIYNREMKNPKYQENDPNE
jgi:hypothetical protein